MTDLQLRKWCLDNEKNCAIKLFIEGTSDHCSLLLTIINHNHYDERALNADRKF